MKDYDDLINRFEDIQDLAVSEEMLGAYIEDNLTDTESLFVRNQIDKDFSLMNLEFAVRSHGNDIPYVDIEAYVSDSLDSLDLPYINDDILPENVAYNHSGIVQSDLIDETDYSSYQLPEIDLSQDTIEEQESSEFDNNP